MEDKFRKYVGQAMSYDYSGIECERALNKMKGIYLGFMTVVDDEDGVFGDVFKDAMEKEAFVQALNRQLAMMYEKDKSLPECTMVGYKIDGDVIFRHSYVETMETYGGYFVVAHYKYDTTIS